MFFNIFMAKEYSFLFLSHWCLCLFLYPFIYVYLYPGNIPTLFIGMYFPDSFFDFKAIYMRMTLWAISYWCLLFLTQPSLDFTDFNRPCSCFKLSESFLESLWRISGIIFLLYYLRNTHLPSIPPFWAL